MEKEVIVPKAGAETSTKVELKFGKKFITRSLRSQSYDLETALSELVDNSIDAGSNNIDIIYPSRSDRRTSQLITIRDNGKGMSKDELINSMTLGSDRDYDDSEIGYFGIGMKASLAYLSEIVNIKTKRKGDSFHTTLIWNVDEETSFIVNTVPDDNIDECGTEITIEPGHRYDIYSHTQESPVKKRFGGRYYHLLYTNELNRDQYKTQVKIMFNGAVIEPVDPMYRNSSETLTSSPEDITWNDNIIKLTGFYLKAHKDNLNYFDTKAGRTSGMSTERSGVYVLLNNKFINLGGTYLGVMQKDTHLNYLRIELSIPKSSTEYFGISMNKNSVSEFLSDEKHTDGVKERIRKGILELAQWGRSQESLFAKKQSSTNTEEIKETEKMVTQLNNELKSKGITKSPLSNPDILDKVPSHKKDKTEKEDTKGTKDRPDDLIYNKSLLDINLYNGGESGEFWDITRKGKQLVLRLNVEHIFYREFISTSSNEEKKKMFKLLFSLAWAQVESLSIYDFDGQINDLWNDFWVNTSRGLKRMLDQK